MSDSNDDKTPPLRIGRIERVEIKHVTCSVCGEISERGEYQSFEKHHPLCKPFQALTKRVEAIEERINQIDPGEAS